MCIAIDELCVLKLRQSPCSVLCYICSWPYSIVIDIQEGNCVCHLQYKRTRNTHQQGSKGDAIVIGEQLGSRSRCASGICPRSDAIFDLYQ